MLMFGLHYLAPEQAARRFSSPARRCRLWLSATKRRNVSYAAIAGALQRDLMTAPLSSCAPFGLYLFRHPAQEVFDRMYAGPEATQQYHAECNKDPNAQVGAWQDGRREVVFATKVNAPAALTRTLGELCSVCCRQMTFLEL